MDCKHTPHSIRSINFRRRFARPLWAAAWLALLAAGPGERAEAHGAALRHPTPHSPAAASRAKIVTPPAKIVVGSLTLDHCNFTYNGYCGSIVRPLDPITNSPGTIKIGFEFYPRTDRKRPSLGTILPQEGGPGYSSTGTRDAYVTLFSPLRDRRDILIVDKRGTGYSDPIDCPELQESADAATLAACGAQLGETAWYYGSALAAADVVAVLDALNIDRVD